MTRLEKIILTIILIAIPIFLLVYWKYDPAMLTSAKATETEEEGKKGKKNKKDDKKDKKEVANVSPGIGIVEQWEMPEVLTEISGIVYLGNNRFACIQDELGKIFIFNTGSNKVEKEVPFGSNGDYEGIAMVNKTAYVLQADGKIFEVNDIDAANPKVKQHTTHLTTEQDAEGLCYDPKNKRLLVAIKGDDPNASDHKGIYGFDLATKKMDKAPVLKIDLKHDVLKGLNEKKIQNLVQPSEIVIHPTTGDIYLTDGKNARLLIMEENGNLKKLYQLNSSDFPQAEGLAFSPEGDLFVASEGGKGKGTIVKVSVD
jgi:DNA-binding beta-propeller fold protein YncE